MVGAAPYALEYTASVRAAADGRVKFLGALYDQDQIDQIYANALTYWHGHSVGGTNPSLLRAAGAGTFTAAMDVAFNREVLGEHGEYFTSPDEVAQLLVKTESDRGWVLDCGSALQQSIRRYNWDDVAERYEDLCRRLAQRDFPRRRPSGRRTGAWTDQPNPARTGGTHPPRSTAAEDSLPDLSPAGCDRTGRGGSGNGPGRDDRGTVLAVHPSPDGYGADLQLVQTVAALVEEGWRVSSRCPIRGRSSTG